MSWKLVVGTTLSMSLLTGCGSSSSVEDLSAESWKKDDLRLSEQFWTSENFSTDIARFKQYGCKPKLDQTGFWRKTKNVPLWGHYVEMKEANVFIEGYPTRFLEDQKLGISGENIWGSQVDQTLMIADAYFGHLRLLHEDINRYYGESNWEYFFNYEPQEKKYDYFTTQSGVLGEFEAYYSRIIGVAEKLCYPGENPSEEQISLAKLEQSDLLNDWEPFRSRLEIISRFVQDANDVISSTLTNDIDEDKPICEEYPTTLPGYSIIKCTNLP